MLLLQWCMCCCVSSFYLATFVDVARVAVGDVTSLRRISLVWRSRGWETSERAVCWRIQVEAVVRVAVVAQ